jgi:hypothetical protein
MQHRLWPIAVLSLGVFVVVEPAGASEPAADDEGTCYVRIKADAFADVSSLGLRAESAINYGSFIWAELSSADVAHLRVLGIPFEAHPDAFVLRLGEQSFDPVVRAPSLPAGWDKVASDGSDLRLVQFAGPTKSAWLDALRAQGLRVVQYIHPFTYVVWGETAAHKAVADGGVIRWTGPFAPAYRVLPRWRNVTEKSLQLDALVYRGADTDAVIQALWDLGARIDERVVLNETFEDVGFSLTGEALQAAAQIPGVYSIQPVPTDGGLRGEMTDQINVNNVDQDNLAYPGYLAWLALVDLTGSGVIIANVDAGVQETHPDLVNRFLSCTGQTCGGAAVDAHGTHTAGIMAADGSSGTTDGYGFLRALGQAPGANLVEQVYSPWFSQPGGMLLLMTDSYNNGASLSGNSWGPAGSPQGYDNDTMQVDIGVRDADPDAPGNQPLSYVLSFMNGYGGTSSQGTPDEAKNIFTIGSTKAQTSGGSQFLTINDLSSNSAHGPALDNRTIPHMVAPGCNVDSSISGSGYGLMCGTSMASPHVSGAVALFIEYYRNLPGFVEDPSPALIKAAFIAVAHDLAGHLDADGGTLGHPFDSKQGWGRMDVEAVVDPQVAVRYFDNPVVFDDTGQEWTMGFSPLDPLAPMRLMLVWTDAPGHGLGGSTPAWNNDLDLIVQVGGDTYRGNHFGASGWSVPGGAADGMNNTEGVFLGPTAPASASVRVVASNINSDGIPNQGDTTDQDFALVCYNCALEPGFALGATPDEVTVCAPQDAVYGIEVIQIMDFADPVTLSSSGEPAGTSVDFDTNPVVPPGSSTMTITNMQAASPGVYTVTVTGTAPALARETTVRLGVYDSIPAEPSLLLPTNDAIAVSRRPDFEWTEVIQAEAYEIEVATDSGFGTIVEAASGLTETAYSSATLLDAGATYYWHVWAGNACGEGNDSDTFSFTTQDTRPVLLVDDDDNVPDVRSYYTDTLDALGQEYDVWNTNNSDNEPDAATLAQYEALVWFTGDEFGGAAGPGSAGEAALGLFLDEGGCLFISAQDYFYDRGLTSFMTGYLGVSTATSDVSQSTVTGAGAVFGGMGPYVLSYPVSNYSDVISPGGTAELAFSGDQGDAAVAKDNGVYHTTFWGFPFEAVVSASDRVDLLGTFLDWCIPPIVDCNNNGIPDDQDIASGTSEDCNENGIPDECEEDCNGNAVPDDCDIAEGTSEDCNENGIPDECEEDCNGNTVPDDCDIAAGTSEDCNENGIPDECDIDSGTSPDSNGNGVPDDCEAEPPIVAAEGGRYLSVIAQPPDSILPVALAVLSPDYPCLAKYVDASGLCTDTPVLQTPGAWAVVHVHGPDIVPDTTYQIHPEVDGIALAAPAAVTTSTWGDTAGEFVDGQWTPPNGVVDFKDIAAAVDAFTHAPIAPPWQWCDVALETPDGTVDFTDIGYLVEAFQAVPYPFGEPDPCP